MALLLAIAIITVCVRRSRKTSGNRPSEDVEREDSHSNLIERNLALFRGIFSVGREVTEVNNEYGTYYGGDGEHMIESEVQDMNVDYGVGDMEETAPTRITDNNPEYE